MLNNSQEELNLRYYQVDAYNLIRKALDEGKNPLCVMATGCGKTAIEAYVMDYLINKGSKGVAIAHRDILLSQMQSELLRWKNHEAKYEKSTQMADWKNDKIIITTPQTLNSDRLLTKPRDRDFILVDEAHRSVTRDMVKVCDHFDRAKRIGMTATIDRLDGISLKGIYDEIVYNYSLKNGIEDGYLCKISNIIIHLDVDRDVNNYIYGEYWRKKIPYYIPNEIEKIVYRIMENTEDRKKVLIFSPNIPICKMLVDELNRNGKNIASYVAGELGDKKNGKILSDFHHGKIKYLVNCLLLTEGYDEPAIDCIVMLRRTDSRILYSQAVGRGTRIYPGKEDCLVIDFTTNTKAHSMVKIPDLFSGEVSPHLIERLGYTIENTGEVVDLCEIYNEVCEDPYNTEKILKGTILMGESKLRVEHIGDLLNIKSMSEIYNINSQLRYKMEATKEQIKFIEDYMDCDLETKELSSEMADQIIKKLKRLDLTSIKSGIELNIEFKKKFPNLDSLDYSDNYKKIGILTSNKNDPPINLTNSNYISEITLLRLKEEGDLTGIREVLKNYRYDKEHGANYKTVGLIKHIDEKMTRNNNKYYIFEITDGFKEISNLKLFRKDKIPEFSELTVGKIGIFPIKCNKYGYEIECDKNSVTHIKNWIPGEMDI